MESLANRYGQELSVGLTMTDIDTWDEALSAVTAEDVMAVAHKVLDRKNAVTGWLTPACWRPCRRSRRRPCRRTRPHACHRRGGPAMIRAVFAAVLLLAAPVHAEIAIQEVTSPGGIKAWLVEDHNIPFTALELQFKGGSSLEAPDERRWST